jgi:hemerythrin-like domain-containing protein
MADSVVNHLRRDHQQARAFLTRFESLLDSLAQGRQWTEELLDSFHQLARFFELDLCLLVRKENELLYPALQGLFAADKRPLALLSAENRDLSLRFHRLFEIGSSLSENGRAQESLREFQESGRRAAEVLEDHLYKEERVLLPLVARFLTSQRDGELLEKMEALRASHRPNEST